MSGSLVIQRLKALHRLGSSGPFGFYGDQHLFALISIQIIVSFFTLIPLIDQTVPEQKVIINIEVLFAVAALAFLGEMVYLMFRYLSHIIYTLLAT